MKINLRQTAPSATAASVRGHQLACDRPTEKGGTDTGPLGGEHFLFGLAGCFTSNLLAAVPEHDPELSGIEVELEAGFADNKITTVHLAVSSEAGSNEALQACVAFAEANCLLVNTLRDTVEITTSVA